jgi:hypothetical protein
MAIDPVTGFAEGVGKGFGEELGKGTRQWLSAGWSGLSRLFRRNARSGLDDLEPVHEALARFSIGKTPGGGGKDMADLPDTGQIGVWGYKNSSLEEVFDDFFRLRVMENRASPEVVAAINEWKALDAAGEVHYWKGRNQDFHLADKGVGEHATIKTLFPFVVFGKFDKQALPGGPDVHPITVIVKMFVDGWVSFLDEKTDFEPRVLLAVGNQAYIDGDFVIKDVHYTVNDKPTVYKNIDLNLYRRLMVTETETKILICMIGVPHEAVPADKMKEATPYYSHAEKLVGGIRILRNF